MIRKYDDQKDHQAALDIWFRASRKGHPFLSEEDLLQQRKIVSEEYFPVADMFVYEQDGKIRGFIGLIGQYIGGLFVSPEDSGRGIGRELLEFAQRLKGSLSVEVYALNSAVQFYEKCGFRETGRKPTDDQGRPLQIIIMEK